MRYRTLDELPPKMASALLRMHTQVVLISEPKMAANTLTALRRHGLVAEGRDKRARPVWKPSPHGLSVIQTESPRLLAARSQRGYTSRPAEAMHGEPEAVSDVWLKKYGQAAGERTHGKDTDEWTRARRELMGTIERLEVLGHHRDVQRSLRAMREQIRVIDRKLKAA